MSAFNRSSQEPSGTTRLNSKLILVAEDHPLNQKVAKLILVSLGFEVHMVGNGLQAVEAATNWDYDAILMDCHMPEMDGFESATRIREHEDKSGAHVPIIAVTALITAGDRERCLNAGMDDYLTKPIQRDLLRQKLVYWMNRNEVSAIRSSANVIQIFDGQCSVAGAVDEAPVKIAELFDAYGEEAAELLWMFVQSTEQTLESLDDAVGSQDYAKLASLAHELKGISWAVGAEEMARLSVFLEQAALQKNSSLSRRTYVRLAHHSGEAKQYIVNRLSAGSSSA